MKLYSAAPRKKIKEVLDPLFAFRIRVVINFIVSEDIDQTDRCHRSSFSVPFQPHRESVRTAWLCSYIVVFVFALPFMIVRELASCISFISYVWGNN